MATSKVGLGWSAGERDYSTLAAWYTARKSTGVQETASCKGDLGTSFVSVAASDFSAGVLIETAGVEYNGANHAALAVFRASFASSSNNLLIKDIAVIHSNGTSACVTLQGTSIGRRLYLQQNANPGSNSATLMTTANGLAENCVVVNTVSTATKVARASSTSTIRNCIVLGGNRAIQTEWTTSNTSKCYAAGSTTTDYYWDNGRPSANVTNASEDGTGDVGYRNLDPTVTFVDYANADYRIRTTSPLHAAGIGAFFQEESVINEVTITTQYAQHTATVNATKDKPVLDVSITGTYPTYTASIAMGNLIPVFTASINSNYPSYVGSGVLTNVKPEKQVQIAATYPVYNSNIDLSNVKPEFSATISSTYPVYTADVDVNGIRPVKTIGINVQYPTYTSVVTVAMIAPGYNAVVNATYPNYIGSSVHTNTKPIKNVSINVTYPSYTVSLNNTNTKPIKAVSITATYGKYSASVTVDLANVNEFSINTTYPSYTASVVSDNVDTNKHVSINSTYPQYMSTVVIGEFLNLPYRGGKGAHLIITLGSREVIFKDKSRNVKWRVENARL